MSTIELRSAAADVAAIAARCAASAEIERELDPAVMAAVVEAGFTRHFAPRRFGGHEGSFSELVAAVGMIGAACPASAWCASLVAGITRMAGAFLPAAGQEQVWATGPDTVLVGSVTPLGKARPVPGGWQLSGRWAYISGVRHAQWALVCGVVESESGSQPVVFAVPRANYTVLDTWFNVGMQATGSNTLVVDDVFVPASLAFDRTDLFAGRSDDEVAPACYCAPLPAVNGLIFVAPAIGAAQGAVKTYAAGIAAKISNAVPLPGVAGVPGQRASYEMTLARSAGEVDCATLLVERAALIADQGAATTPLETARNLRDCALAVDLTADAVHRMFRQAGTSGQSTSGALQRFWRDVTTISTHVALQFEPAAHGYADQALKI